MFNTAFEGFVGASYSPIALISTQSVSGKNYCFFCESGKITGKPNASYCFVYIYKDMDGAVNLSNILNYNG